MLMPVSLSFVLRSTARFFVRASKRLVPSVALSALVLLVAGIPLEGVAQPIRGIEVGDRVRFVAPEVAGPDRIEGTLHRLYNQSIVVRPFVGQEVTTVNGTVLIPHSRLEILELRVSKGSTGGQVAAGAMVGLLAGVAGTALYCAVNEDSFCALSSVLFVPAGIVGGMVWGSSRDPHEWIPLVLPGDRTGDVVRSDVGLQNATRVGEGRGPELRRGVRPTVGGAPGGGISLGVRIRF